MISPFGLGLTRVAAEAVLAPTLDEARRFVPLTHSTASCSGAVWFHHRLLFNRAVPVRDEGDKLAWALSPGQHLGVEEPSSSQRCVQVYSPLDRIEGQPSSKPMLRVEELDIPAPRIELSGGRLGLSRVNAQVRFPVCRAATPAFQGCDAKPADSSALRPGLLDPPGPAPLGMEVRAEAQVVKEGGVTIVALTLDALGVPASVQRKQSLVLALPEAVCEEAPRSPSPELIAAMKRAAIAPRATAVRLLLPEIETSTLLAAGAPAPLDGLLVSATMRTLSCQASPAAPLPEGVTTIAANRPFYYAIIDEATQTLLLLGRFDELTRFERRSPLGIPPDMAAPPRGQGGVAPLK
ncbi:MAG: hypothetical protein U0359_14100 [Byssovorax sp.]